MTITAEQLRLEKRKAERLNTIRVAAAKVKRERMLARRYAIEDMRIELQHR